MPRPRSVFVLVCCVAALALAGSLLVARQERSRGDSQAKSGAAGHGDAARPAGVGAAAQPAEPSRFGHGRPGPQPIVTPGAARSRGAWRGAAENGVAVPLEWLSKNLERRDVVVVDTRGGDAYRNGHIPGALSLPADSVAVMTDAADAGAAFGRHGIRGAERIVCCTDTAAFAPAARLFWLLEAAGAERVGFLDGGFDAWRRSGGAIEAASAERPPATWSPQPDSRRVASRDDVRDRFGEPGYEILDVRSVAEWEGRATGASPDARARSGHVPHSLPLHPYSLFRVDGTFQDVDTLLTALRRSGPRAVTPLDMDAEFIVYDDGRSSEGALAYMLLRFAGIDPLRYWPGGWAAWAADTTLPFTRIVSAEELLERIPRKRGLFMAEAPSPRLVLLDVRERHDFDIGRMRGAALLPSHQFADSLEVVLGAHWPGVDRSEVPCVAYCYGVECVRSRICTTIAARHGFIKLEWFRGGMDEWLKAGGEVLD